jgi:hypothetical protein
VIGANAESPVATKVDRRNVRHLLSWKPGLMTIDAVSAPRVTICRVWSLEESCFDHFVFTIVQ